MHTNRNIKRRNKLRKTFKNKRSLKNKKSFRKKVKILRGGILFVSEDMIDTFIKLFENINKLYPIIQIQITDKSKQELTKLIADIEGIKNDCRDYDRSHQLDLKNNFNIFIKEQLFTNKEFLDNLEKTFTNDNQKSIKIDKIKQYILSDVFDTNQPFNIEYVYYPLKDDYIFTLFKKLFDTLKREVELQGVNPEHKYGQYQGNHNNDEYNNNTQINKHFDDCINFIDAIQIINKQKFVTDHFLNNKDFDKKLTTDNRIINNFYNLRWNNR